MKLEFEAAKQEITQLQKQLNHVAHEKAPTQTQKESFSFVQLNDLR